MSARCGQVDPFKLLDEMDGELLTWWRAYNRLQQPKYRQERHNALLAETDPMALLSMQSSAFRDPD